MLFTQVGASLIAVVLDEVRNPVVMLVNGPMTSDVDVVVI